MVKMVVPIGDDPQNDKVEEFVVSNSAVIAEVFLGPIKNCL